MSESACSQLIHRVLCELLLGGEGQAENEAVAAALRCIHSRLHQPLTVRDAAAAARLSPAHFSRVFKAQTGYSPYEYILLRRIDEAKHLLTSTGLSVKEVAYQVGYNSEENFIHSFQKKVGVSPASSVMSLFESEIVFCGFVLSRSRKFSPNAKRRSSIYRKTAVLL